MQQPGKKLDFPQPDPIAPQQERARSSPGKGGGGHRWKALLSVRLFTAIAALATVGIFVFYLYDSWRDQVAKTIEVEQKLNRLVDQALFEMSEDSDGVEVDLDCHPPLGEARKSLDGAKLKLDEAFGLNPKHPRALTALGIYHMKLCEKDRAAYYFHEAIRIDASFAKAHYNLGAIHIQNKDSNKAIAEFTIAAELDEEDPRSFLNLGTLYMQDKNYTKAAENFKIAANRKPGSSVFWEQLGAAYLLNESWAEAMLALRKAVELDGSNHFALYNLGLACRKAGSHLEAITHLRRAIDNEQDLKQAYPLLGDSLSVMGRHEEGKSILEECRSRWPDFEECRMVLEEISKRENP